MHRLDTINTLQTDRQHTERRTDGRTQHCSISATVSTVG